MGSRSQPPPYEPKWMCVRMVYQTCLRVIANEFQLRRKRTSAAVPHARQRSKQLRLMSWLLLIIMHQTASAV